MDTGSGKYSKSNQKWINRKPRKPQKNTKFFTSGCGRATLRELAEILGESWGIEDLKTPH